MTLPSSGAMTFAMINGELGYPASNAISFEDPVVLALAGVSAGAAISMASFYGKTAATTLHCSASPSTQSIGTGLTLTTGTATIAAAGGTGTGFTYSTAITTPPGTGASANVSAGATTANPTIQCSRSTRGSYTVGMTTTVHDSGSHVATCTWSITFVFA